MNVLRTPEERFADLPGFGWRPHYAEVKTDGAASLRMAYIDEGPPGARPVLLLHGEPSWSLLYRSMIDPLLDAGLRVVAPDLIGFGRSDKPADQEDYTYQRHMEWLTDLVVHRLDLAGAVLFCQDWGGLLGLRLVAEHPRALRRRRRVQHDAADRRPGSGRRLPRVARLLTERPRVRRSGASSTAGPNANCPSRRSPPTTPPSPTTASRPARAASPRSCRSRPTTPPRPPTAPRGRF